MNRQVFINCPFSYDYQNFFYAIMFTVIRSGYEPRCALEADDGSENRFEKICRIIGDSVFTTSRRLNRIQIPDYLASTCLWNLGYSSRRSDLAQKATNPRDALFLTASHIGIRNLFPTLRVKTFTITMQDLKLSSKSLRLGFEQRQLILTFPVARSLRENLFASLIKFH